MSINIEEKERRLYLGDGEGFVEAPGIQVPLAVEQEQQPSDPAPTPDQGLVSEQPHAPISGGKPIISGCVGLGPSFAGASSSSDAVAREAPSLVVIKLLYDCEVLPLNVSGLHNVKHPRLTIILRR